MALKNIRRNILMIIFCVMFNLIVVNNNTDAQTAFPKDSVIVTIAYAPESSLYMPTLIDQFNSTACYASLPKSPDGTQIDKPICIYDLTNKGGFSSGTFANDLVRYITNPATKDLNVLDTANLPIIFQPSTTHWLRYINLKTQKTIFDFSPGAVTLTTQVPVTIAIWESRLQAIERKLQKTRDNLGWDDLLNVLNLGWHEFGYSDTERDTVWYVQTNPNESSTGLSVLLSQFQTALRELPNQATSKLETREQVESLVGRVAEYQTLVRHYMPRTTEMRTLFKNGTNYLDFAPLEEYDVIRINSGTGTNCPVSLEPVLPIGATDRLVALYPRDGVVIHEHPLGIVQEVAGWGTKEQREGAQEFARFVISEPAQRIIMSCGLRPREIKATDELFTNEKSGVPQTLIFSGEGNTPGLDQVVFPTEVIGAVLDSWNAVPSVRKSSDLLIVFDISESMLDTEGKLANAQKAVRELISLLPAGTRVGLTVFSSDVVRLVDLGTESARDQIRRSITDDIGNVFNADGINISFAPSTELYSALAQSLQYMEKECGSKKRICNIILVSDGFDEREAGVAPKYSLDDIYHLILNNSTISNTPVNIFPLAYDYASQGSNEAKQAQEAVERIAEASRTQVFTAALDAKEGEDDIFTILRRLALLN